jgi:hypothetical protein
VGSDADRPSVRFQPLRPASRGRLAVALVLGPLLWVVALAVAAWLFAYTWAIQIGLLVTLGSFLVALAMLAVLRTGRERQARRYADRR